MIEELKLERSTWELLRALYTDRLAEEGMDQQMIEDDGYRSHKEVADKFFSQNSAVRQAQVRRVSWSLRE